MPDDPRTDPQDRSWFGPHDRLFTDEESDPVNFVPGPSHGAFRLFFCFRNMLTTKQKVWCWGWDGAGDLEGPDVEPIWEAMPNKSRSSDAVLVRHDRSIPL